MNEGERLDPAEDAPLLDGESLDLLRQRCAEELGTEPSEEQLAIWVREHPESE